MYLLYKKVKGDYMEKSYKTALIAVTIVCLTTILGLSAVLYYYLNQYGTYGRELESIYKKNLYELVNNVNSVEVDISKIVATTSFDTQQKLLNSIYKSCGEIEANLNNLPISEEKTKNVTKLYNTLSGYTYSLIRANTTLSDDNLDSLEDMHTSCLIVMYDLNNYLNEVSYSYSILSDIDFGSADDSVFNGGFTESNIDDSEVPTLIYDGPFSDSVTNREVKGLGDIEISESQAKSIVEEKFVGYEPSSIMYVGDTIGKFATYNYEVVAKDNITLYVQVTKLGGVIISINSNAESGNFEYSEELTKELAQNFAINIGYEDMYPVWIQVSGNIAYVNLAPMVDGVIYYPDLVKVKVDMTRAQVVGLDGTNYCYNHVSRSVEDPSVSVETAKSNVGSKLEIVDTNLAIIPNEFVGETYVYEFICTWKDYQYFVYVDAMTGEEVDILRVIKTTSGNLII